MNAARPDRPQIDATHCYVIMKAMADKAESQENSLEGAYRHRRPLLRALARKAGDAEAEDLVQDAFVKTLETEQHQPLQSGLAYLVRVTRNAVVDRLRSKSYRAEIVIDTSEGVFEATDPTPDPERAAIASDRLARTMAIIERLPPRRREVLKLHRFENLSYAEIGERMGISRRTAEGQLAAAMAQIHRELDQNDHEDE